MNDRILGPNKRRLVAICASAVARPKGGTFADFMAAISSVESIKETTRKAMELADDMIFVFRSAPDNPYGDDEEAIAGAILAELDKKRP